MDLIYLKKLDPQKANTLEKSIYNRYSERSFKGLPVKLNTLSKIIWSAQGTTNEPKRRTTPSAGAIHPLELFIISKDVTDLENGIYHYLPQEHALDPQKEGSFMESLACACFHQTFIQDAAFAIIIAGDFEKTKQKYRERGERYIFMEAGHACQNMSLMATNLLLGTVVIGAFNDKELRDLLNLGDWYPITVMPFGYEK
ncbi:MAG: SagB/ThcOx family dehydrogenase [Candidatus Aenigmarchaeota archaeon]|nr:SagB/ThcOx family dehydrogenase [Candidatus Aenigmarchaeota archaeon]